MKGWACRRRLANTSEGLNDLQFGQREMKVSHSEDSNTMVRNVRGHWDALAAFCSPSLLPCYQESTEGKGLRQQQERLKLDNRRHCLTNDFVFGPATPLGLRDVSSPARDRTQALSNGSAES